jgi:PelA/Pel-15E family pectate lyase
VKSVFSLFFVIVTLITTLVSAQDAFKDKADSYLSMDWKKVAIQMPSEWYGSQEAKRVAENLLFCQKDIGGWQKNIPYHHSFSESEKARFIKDKFETGATFDNDATITELIFLAKVYSHTKENNYKQSFEKGLEYIIISQYENGGWPQFFPFRKDKGLDYSSHITFNDNAMVNIMLFLKDVIAGKEDYSSMQLNIETKTEAQKAFDKGIECILKSQIIINGKQTVWCAQHDAVTLAPAGARSYELPSYSGWESAGITLFLMEIDNPDKEIIASVNGAVKWFEDNKIEGIKLETKIDKDGKKDRVVVEDKSASPIWARFYDLETSQPFFCDRDGIRKKTLAEIGYERRNGYSWYSDKPAKILKKYPQWFIKWNEN